MNNTQHILRDPTHTLLSETYAEPLVAIARVTHSYSDSVFVRISHGELPDSGDLPENPTNPYERGIAAIHSAWSRVSDAFEPAETSIEWGHSADQTASTYRLDEDSSALTHLLDLTKHQINGAHFVAEILFVSNRRPVLYGLPHHQTLTVDTKPIDSERYLDAVADALSDQAACLATCEELTWEYDGTRYRLSGASLCIDSSGNQSACWQLTRLRRLTIHPTRPELIADWNPVTERPILGAVVRGLTRISPIPAIPERIPCPNRETAQQAHDLVAETFQQYDGRSM